MTNKSSLVFAGELEIYKYQRRSETWTMKKETCNRSLEVRLIFFLNLFYFIFFLEKKLGFLEYFLAEGKASNAHNDQLYLRSSWPTQRESGTPSPYCPVGGILAHSGRSGTSNPTHYIADDVMLCKPHLIPPPGIHGQRGCTLYGAWLWRNCSFRAGNNLKNCQVGQLPKAQPDFAT